MLQGYIGVLLEMMEVSDPHQLPHHRFQHHRRKGTEPALEKNYVKHVHKLVSYPDPT